MPESSDLAPFGLVRIVATDGPEFYAAVRDYQTHGLRVAAVLAWETFGGSNHPSVWADTCDRLARSCHPDLWIVGNEEDAGALGVPSPASWIMSPEKYAELWLACETAIRARDPEARLCLGGLVSGQPPEALAYLEAVWAADGHPDAYDVHPYAKGVLAAELLLDAYRYLIPDLALEVLEWNRPTPEIPAFVRMLERIGVEYAAYFSWHTFDVPGLHDADGNPTDRYSAYLGALSGSSKSTTSEGPNQELKEKNMAKIEQREQAEDFPLGQRWPLDKPGKIKTIGTGVRVAGYERGVALEIDGETWELPHVGSLGELLPKD